MTVTLSGPIAYTQAEMAVKQAAAAARAAEVAVAVAAGRLVGQAERERISGMYWRILGRAADLSGLGTYENKSEAYIIDALRGSSEGRLKTAIDKGEAWYASGHTIEDQFEHYARGEYVFLRTGQHVPDFMVDISDKVASILPDGYSAFYNVGTDSAGTGIMQWVDDGLGTDFVGWHDDHIPDFLKEPGLGGQVFWGTDASDASHQAWGDAVGVNKEEVDMAADIAAAVGLTIASINIGGWAGVAFFTATQSARAAANKATGTEAQREREWSDIAEDTAWIAAAGSAGQLAGGAGNIYGGIASAAVLAAQAKAQGGEWDEVLAQFGTSAVAPAFGGSYVTSGLVAGAVDYAVNNDAESAVAAAGFGAARSYLGSRYQFGTAAVSLIQGLYNADSLEREDYDSAYAFHQAKRSAQFGTVGSMAQSGILSSEQNGNDASTFNPFQLNTDRYVSDFNGFGLYNPRSFNRETGKTGEWFTLNPEYETTSTPGLIRGREANRISEIHSAEGLAVTANFSNYYNVAGESSDAAGYLQYNPTVTNNSDQRRIRKHEANVAQMVGVVEPVVDFFQTLLQPVLGTWNNVSEQAATQP